MKGTLMSSDHFWQLLRFLVDKENTYTFSEVSDTFDISEEVIISIVNILKNHGYEFKKSREGFSCVKKSPEAGGVDFLEIVRLLSVQEKLEEKGEYLGATLVADVLRNFEEKVVSFSHAVGELELRYSHYFNESNIIHLGVQQESMVKRLESAILNKKAVYLSFCDMEGVVFLPLRVVHIDGDLCCVGEDIENSDMIHLSLSDISSVENCGLNYKTLYSKFEIDDYLVGLRSLSETQVRLILKLGDGVQINEPEYQYFANPILIKKNDGFKIWAASVEPNEEVFEWLCSLGSKVEIIDPSAFKRMFLKYCENRLNLISA